MPSIFSPASESASALTSTASPAATTPTANTSNTSPISVPSTRRSTSQVAQSLASWPDTTSTSISPTSPTPLPTHTPSSADSNNKNNKNNAPSRRNESLSPSPAAQKPRSSFLRRLSPGLAARVKLLDDSSKSTPTALTRSRSTIDTTTPEADSRVSDPSGPLLTAQVGEKLTEMSAVQEVQTTVLDTEASHGSGSPTDLEKYLRSSVQPAEGAPPPPPPKDSPPLPANGSSTNVESYFNPLGLSRTESIYSFSRATFSNQLSQLTSISLPQPASLEASIKAISTAPAAVRALSGAASQIQQWIDKASDVLSGLDAEDDVEWAAAGGREGLEDVDKAVSKFESLVNVYVKAIEEVQLRNDIADVGSDQLRAIVVQVESTLENWKGVKSQLRGVKEQVELAMEWEELWTNVLGDVESETEPNNSLDINELETIVEESPAHGSTSSSSQYKHGHVFGAAPPQLEAPTVQNAEDDSSLLALFARMQPLRASLAFLPMRLSMFQSRAEKIFPSACDELEARRKRLEKGYKKLEADAEALRRELGEDRWNLVFRNAGRQAHKMFKSVERTINKLQEAIDSGFHNANSAALAKKIESFENKKVHYGEAIDRVLAIIQKGINDRLTVNGEIIRLLADLKARSEAMKDRICVMDSLLEDLNATKSQQLRDSISSIVTLDSPATRSAIDTPDSSPASSVVMSSTNGVNSGVASSINGSSRRGSSTGNPITKATATKLKRYSGLPQAPPAPRRSSIPRTTSTSSHLTSPSPRLSTLSPTPSTPRPGSRNSYGQQNPTSNKPRWNGSANTNDLIVGHNFKPLSLTTPSPHRKLNFPTNSRSCLPLPSPLSRESSASPAPSSRRPSSRLTGSRIASPAPDRGGVASPTPTRSRLIGPPPYSKFCKNSSSTLTGPSPALSKTPRSRQSYAGQPSARAVSTNTLNTIGGSGENGAKKAATRPGTALGHSSRRTSMLPQPRGSKSGRDSMGLSSKGLEERPPWR
ncbi:conserved hypothetical protein [Histoplasma mississippiense (nom. inval.)]|uniref:conserved hypothetical protein n=1 Tax=Ajellomyces capsulatus (strain NAm1 / WU24) TaxID=2059318 RepID=UPI000157C1FA|nr:conserved hypothetical protein [Histoplasma mississippiense (nom. inval.)]EDN07187.1 conserved hypothetical protein [Histoplasma mississippiense (nom. inval.)]